VGRTGRAGKSGEAVLLLSPFEAGFVKELRDIPIQDHNLPDSELETGKKEEKVIELAKRVLTPEMINDVFQSLLGYCMLLLGSF
jgi:superfamily II DNA/RNA helicase